MIRLFMMGFLMVGTLQALEPMMMIRLRAPQNESPELWQRTVDVFKKYRLACDEVWFSTGIGYPSLEWHRTHAKRLAAAAEDLRRIQIIPSLQFQATLGHSDGISASVDTSAKQWSGFVGPDGSETRFCSCPRQPAFHAYMREMAKIYAAWQPGSVWIDDDLRIGHHPPVEVGCFCETCMRAFSDFVKKPYNRLSLVAALKKDSALAAAWDRFRFEGIAEVARIIATEIHAISPKTRMGYQHCIGSKNQRLMFQTLAKASGFPARSRPGGGAYEDHNPYTLIDKAYFLSRQMEVLGDTDDIDQICPEIENYPRTFSCKTGQGLAIESLLHLSQGMNALSYLILDATYETPEWYGDALLQKLAQNAPLFRAYIAHNEGTRPGGLSGASLSRFTVGIPLCPGLAYPCGRILTLAEAKGISRDALSRLLQQGVLTSGVAAEVLVKRSFGTMLGISSITPAMAGTREVFTSDPLNAEGAGREHGGAGSSFSIQVSAPHRVLGEYSNWTGKKFGAATVLVSPPGGGRVAVLGCGGFSANTLSSARILQLGRIADWVSGGKLPVRMESPAQCVVFPRVTKEGILRSVSMLNASIDDQQPVTVRLRGCAEGSVSVQWNALNEKPVDLPVRREGADLLVTIPRIAPWNMGWLKL